jgi:hypothetical protein
MQEARSESYPALFRYSRYVQRPEISAAALGKTYTG